MEALNADPQIARRRINWPEIRERFEKSGWAGYSGKIYGVPRGGAIVAGLLFPAGNIVDCAKEADLIVDDIVDSGLTKTILAESYPDKMFWALVDKKAENLMGTWVEFPWEAGEVEKDGEALITRMLELIGEDPTREGIIATPERVVRSWGEIFKGYKQDPREHLKTFEKGTYDQMIVLKDCELYSTCEHHLQPFHGKIHIGYIPGKNVIGISKLARIAECFSRRMQIQERIGEQITDFLEKELGVEGAGVVIEAQHFCMCSRGVNKQNSLMVTSSLKGVFRKQEVREEFLRLAGL